MTSSSCFLESLASHRLQLNGKGEEGREGRMGGRERERERGGGGEWEKGRDMNSVFITQ